MRRLVVIGLIACAAAAAAAALGATGGSGQGGHPLAGLNRTFRSLVPDARCDAAATKLATARRLRTTANRNVDDATAKQINAKKAKLRRAIRLLRTGGDLCEAAAPAPPATGAPPPTTTSPPGGTPPAPAGPQKVTLHGTNQSPPRYAETSATARSAEITFELVNPTMSLEHTIDVRTMSGQPSLGGTGVAQPGQTKSVKITLPPGSYEIFCSYDGHDANGMHIPFTVSP